MPTDVVSAGQRCRGALGYEGTQPTIIFVDALNQVC